jgi:hypothetical protein
MVSLKNLIQSEIKAISGGNKCTCQRKFFGFGIKEINTDVNTVYECQFICCYDYGEIENRASLCVGWTWHQDQYSEMNGICLKAICPDLILDPFKL